MEVFPDTLSYTVLDVNYAVAGSTRYQNVSMKVSYAGGRVVAGFYDRCTRTGQLNENKPLLDINVVRISQISLSADGQFAKNSVKSLDFDVYRSAPQAIDKFFHIFKACFESQDEREKTGPKTASVTIAPPHKISPHVWQRGPLGSPSVAVAGPVPQSPLRPMPR